MLARMTRSHGSQTWLAGSHIVLTRKSLVISLAIKGEQGPDDNVNATEQEA